MSKFAKRSEEKELMDDLNCSGEELNQTLRELKTINRWLGGNYVTTSGLEKIFKRYPQESYAVADIGCGGGDMIRVMHDWAKRQKKEVNFTGIDANRNIIDLAAVRLADLPKVAWRAQNVFDTGFSSEKVDISTCTLFTHHFTDGELVNLLQSLREKSRLGIVINDLHRHPLAYYSIKWLTGVFSKSKMVQNDAALSVLRSFSRSDWERIAKAAQLDHVEVSWHWAFRWRVIIIFK
ncbi:methyltransferase family protein [Algoriphagus ratkowskyi]|uniref:Methyltransferase domain-containing protein n=1 Tax=Algoriphagus ratkowskyi TaxID=57028 RepID=A0A2W7R1F9_9BACT|nr:methyltransferase domain-containing protein [Algoriphagus ratkowskyi]PZX54608.1 methyltransferase family protein [Algoriphagus ratkowskyi]TXD76921.1 methyltransferase domain-containing protein [Algoriphagus ratkowskyi]